MTIITNPIQLTPDDVKEIANTGKPFYQKHIGKIWIGILIIGFIVALPNSNLKALLVLTQSLIIITLIVFVLRKLWEWAERYALQKSGVFEKPIFYIIDSEYIERQSDKGTDSKTPWSGIRKLVVADKFYLLYQRRAVYWIPVDAFKSEEDIEAFQKVIFALDVPMKFYD